MNLAVVPLLVGSALAFAPSRVAGPRAAGVPRHACPRAQIGSYSVRLPKPLGICFEEASLGEPQGVVVAGLVEGGNAEADGRVLVGDRLIRVSAVQFGGQQALVSLGAGTQFTAVSRELIPVTKMDFDTIMAAIGSNEGRWGYTDVVLEFQHTDASVPRASGAAPGARREGGADVDWDGARGTTVNGVSTPMRPAPEDF